MIGTDVQCFDVERGLAKALGIRVETFQAGPGEFKFRIGQRWNLVVDADQLGMLWDAVDSQEVLRDTFNNLKADCLGFQAYKP